MDDEDNYRLAGMNGHCRCDRKHWVIVQFMCNHSAFNGYHKAYSNYSEITCEHCGHRWRTKAKYVNGLPMVNGART